MSVPSPPPRIPTRKVARRPLTNWEKMSCPKNVVPNQYVRDARLGAGRICIGERFIVRQERSEDCQHEEEKDNGETDE